MKVGLVRPLWSSAEVVVAFVGVLSVVVVEAGVVVEERKRLMKEEDGVVEKGEGVVRESRKFLRFVSNS